MRAGRIRRTQRMDLDGAGEEGVGNQQVIDEFPATVKDPGEPLGSGDTGGEVG